MSSIFSISGNADFEQNCLATFRKQAVECEPYARYVSLLGVDVQSVAKVEQIPFLPIELFKSEQIVCGGAEPQVTFTSSGTTGTETSRHLVTDVAIYEQSFLLGFEHFYGSPSKYCILALLPSYLERQGSSLVYMVERLVKESENSNSGFFLYNYEELVLVLQKMQAEKQPTLLIGVTFALLDLVEKHTIIFPDLVVMETGGMKGMRRELPREELHSLLCRELGVKSIHSEYGMTELLSQGYSSGSGIFYCPPWMKTIIRDANNPFMQAPFGAIGGINAVDLANQNSCSFIQTQDLGRALPNGGFEVLGRMDKSQARGCNMLMS
ncbi:MAG: acyltransferase [Prevotellaceae bacterium]|nr:acyltransferase [Prevotellaceae bacterium]